MRFLFKIIHHKVSKNKSLQAYMSHRPSQTLLLYLNWVHTLLSIRQFEQVSTVCFSTDKKNINFSSGICHFLSGKNHTILHSMFRQCEAYLSVLHLLHLRLHIIKVTSSEIFGMPSWRLPVITISLLPILVMFRFLLLSVFVPRPVGQEIILWVWRGTLQ